MQYDEDKIDIAFNIYLAMATAGEIRRDNAKDYFADDDVKSLVERFGRAAGAIIVQDSEFLYLVPIAEASPFHMTNEEIKKNFLPGRAVNLDIYMMYLAILVLFACFYDSSDTDTAADFVTMDRWLEDMDLRMNALASLGEEKLRKQEAEQSINWTELVRKWEDLDSINEKAAKQDARTKSRVSVLNTAKDFLIAQKLLRDIGENELELTEKAKAIVYNYFWDADYNRGILDFIYNLEKQENSTGEAEN